MYYSNITNDELYLFHGLKVQSFTITLSDILTSSLFMKEEIVENSIYRIYPLFYCDRILLDNDEDKVLDNKCIICSVSNSDKHYTFINNESSEILDYNSTLDYFGISDTLTEEEFNGIVSLLRRTITHKESFNLKEGIINGVYGDYEVDIGDFTISDKGVIIDNSENTISFKLLNPKFHYVIYVLSCKLYYFEDFNVSETSSSEIEYEHISLNLVDDEFVSIPLSSLANGGVVELEVNVEVLHNLPVIPDIPKSIYLSSDKAIIQSGEEADLTALVKDNGGVPVGSGHTVYFYEVYEPSLLSLSGDKSIMQSGEVLDLKATLKDEDGSLVEGETIYFYEKIEEEE